MEAAPAVSITPKIQSQEHNKKKGKTVAGDARHRRGQLNIDSTPQGAQIQVDGQAAGVTPFTWRA